MTVLLNMPLDERLVLFAPRSDIFYHISSLKLFIHASGAAFNCDKEDGSFELIARQYISQPNPTLDLFGSGERLADLFCHVCGISGAFGVW